MAAVNNDIYVYTGGRVPERLRAQITHARIDESVGVIDDEAFRNCQRLQSVEIHTGVYKIGKWAFSHSSLKRVEMSGVKAIQYAAFSDCSYLTDVKCEIVKIIGDEAFWNCGRLRGITAPSIKVIGKRAFCGCVKIVQFDLPEGIIRIGDNAFSGCFQLTQITMPLKDDMISNGVFTNCRYLWKVNLIGEETHKSISSLHLESWRNDVNEEINRIINTLPYTNQAVKTAVIQQWMSTVLRKINHYKAKHYALLKEATTLLELAVWKVRLDDEKTEQSSRRSAKKAKIDVESARKDRRITSGASIVIKNVLPFLNLEVDNVRRVH
jgi:hypothetical protein